MKNRKHRAHPSVSDNCLMAAVLKERKGQRATVYIYLCISPPPHSSMAPLLLLLLLFHLSSSNPLLRQIITLSSSIIFFSLSPSPLSQSILRPRRGCFHSLRIPHLFIYCFLLFVFQPQSCDYVHTGHEQWKLNSG